MQSNRIADSNDSMKSDKILIMLITIRKRKIESIFVPAHDLNDSYFSASNSIEGWAIKANRSGHFIS